MLHVWRQDLVSNNQMGFLKGQSIAENICLINNAISYIESKNIPRLLLFVHFEKAFDTIERAFVEKTVHHFGFGSSLIKWINLFYRDIQSCVINNRFFSTFLWTKSRCKAGVSSIALQFYLVRRGVNYHHP